ncbi:hypothetical protein Q7P35_001934 [Cladosporium inversicolor]
MIGNTVNPNQLFNMTNSTDETQNFDQSLVDVNDLENFNMADLDSLNFFASNNGIVDSTLHGLPTATPTFDNVNYFRQPQEMIPMPQSLNPSPATFAPPQGLPAMMPATKMAYHPEIGWYYPVANAPIPGFPGTGSFGAAPAYAAPPAPVFTQAPVAPFAPADPFATMLADVTAKRSQAKRTPASNKRKYGPAQFFEDREHSKRRAIGDGNSPLPVTRDSKKHTASQAAGAMKELNIATVQRCRCELGTNATEPHIPRPRNAFIIYRGDISSRYRTSRDTKRGTANADISIAAGKMWKELGAQGQAPYKARADREKEEHRSQYPNYQYAPMKKIEARFGHESCTCGAYEINMKELKRLREGGATPPNLFMRANETENDNGEYKAPRTRSVSRANSIQAPTAQAVPHNFDVDMSGFDFSREIPENWDFEALQTFSNAAEDFNAAQPPVTPRSSRSGKKAVHYVDEATTSTATHKHRPPLISTSRKSNNSSQISELNSGDFKFDDKASVSSRTRSKSVSQSEDEMALTTGNSPLDSLVGDDDDVGDNIVVATPKASPKHTVLALPPRTSRQTRSQSRGRARRRS